MLIVCSCISANIVAASSLLSYVVNACSELGCCEVYHRVANVV